MGFDKVTSYFKKKWSWAIFLAAVAAIIGFATFLIQRESSLHEFGGKLNATFHDKSLKNKESRTIVVCIDDTAQYERNIYLTPTFDNSDEFTIRDFSLTYEVTAYDMEIIPSPFVDAYKTGRNSIFYQYKMNVLEPKRDTKNPFMGFKLQKDVARCEIVSKVSFDGASEIFECRTDVWFVYKPNPKNVSFDYWKLNCKQKIYDVIDDKFFDVYYFSEKYNPEYQFDVDLAKDRGKSASVKGKNSPAKEEKILTESKTKGKDIPAAEIMTLAEDKVKGKDIPAAEKRTLAEDKAKEYADTMIAISEYPSESAEKNSDLDIDDYSILSGDTSKIHVVLNRPVGADGIFIVTFKARQEGEKRTIYNYVSLKAGQKEFDIINRFNFERIARVKFYHQVNPEDYIRVEREDSGLALTPRYVHMLMGEEYGDDICYVREMERNFIVKKGNKKVVLSFFKEADSFWDVFALNDIPSLSPGMFILLVVLGVLIPILFFLGFFFSITTKKKIPHILKWLLKWGGIITISLIAIVIVSVLVLIVVEVVEAIYLSIYL